MSNLKNAVVTTVFFLSSSTLAIAEQGYFTDGPNFKEGLVNCGPFYEEGTECRQLATTFGYSKNGNSWETPAGTITDGASIPSWAQWFIGAPFSKEFEPASILHDHYVRPKHQVRTYLETQRMFYDVLIDTGVDPIKAGTMYAAILVGGSAWTVLVDGEPCENFDDNCVRTSQGALNFKSINRVDSSFNEIDMESLMTGFSEQIEAGNLPPEEIEKLAIFERVVRGIETPAPTLAVQ
jgi:hypothetical protein